MFAISTGEPPTPPVAPTASVSSQTGGQTLENRIQSDSSSQSLSNQQEPDSGYEASPCSITDATTDDLHFFGEEPAAPGQSNPEDDVFDDFVLLEPEDCCCGTASPCCCSRAESSATILEGDQSSNCDSSDSDSHQARPSSLPIRIPTRHHPVARWSSASHPPQAMWSSAGQPPQARVSSSGGQHSWTNSNLPTATRTRALHQSLCFPFRTLDLPRSCPIEWPLDTSRSPLARMTSQMERLCRRASLQNQRRRRLQIDSDASSNVDSSDDNFLSDDGLDDEVFPMAAEAEPGPRLAPLPDIVLHSSHPQSSVVRRFRSASINLPPEPEVLQNIGSTLRRLSDQFENRRNANRRRRQTITSFDLR